MPTTKLPFEKAMQADDLQRLLTLKMPYGKYEGRYIADLPGIIWLVCA
jgi:uncharacterized protein (DUF3820 family)